MIVCKYDVIGQKYIGNCEFIDDPRCVLESLDGLTITENGFALALIHGDQPVFQAKFFVEIETIEEISLFEILKTAYAEITNLARDGKVLSFLATLPPKKA